jgi:hypothetical protein
LKGLVLNFEGFDMKFEVKKDEKKELVADTELKVCLPHVWSNGGGQDLLNVTVEGVC